MLVPYFGWAVPVNDKVAVGLGAIGIGGSASTERLAHSLRRQEVCRIMNQHLASRFQSGRADEDLVLLEGFHALKHAIRFGADILEVAVIDRQRLYALRDALAPDLDLGRLRISDLPAEQFRRLVSGRVSTGVVALARRPVFDPAGLIGSCGPAPIVLLENPRRLENVGACVRVAAAAGAAAVLCIGEQDPWHPAAVRGAAGLQFALPVARLPVLPATDRTLIAFDAAGDTLGPDSIPDGALLAFGTEREGLSEQLRAIADCRLRIPMRPGVSSLNLATAVAVALYAWRGFTA